jgi:hypothetical protein
MASSVTLTGKTPLEQHAELIGLYDVKTGASKAQVSRRITELELDMTLDGVEFTPWEKPVAYSTKWLISESELIDQITKLYAVRDNGEIRENIREAAERRLAKMVDQAQRRGVEVPQDPKTVKPRAVKAAA